MAYWHSGQAGLLLLNVALNNLLGFAALLLGIRAHST
jgi:hypothetical protein